MGIMITYHGFNNPMYNAHQNVGVRYTWQNAVLRAEDLEPCDNCRGEEAGPLLKDCQLSGLCPHPPGWCFWCPHPQCPALVHGAQRTRVLDSFLQNLRSVRAHCGSYRSMMSNLNWRSGASASKSQDEEIFPLLKRRTLISPDPSEKPYLRPRKHLTDAITGFYR